MYGEHINFSTSTSYIGYLMHIWIGSPVATEGYMFHTLCFVSDLRDDNLHLRERNQALMGYIDTLLLTIIEAKPDLLEVKPFQSNSSNSNSSVTVWGKSQLWFFVRFQCLCYSCGDFFCGSS